MKMQTLKNLPLDYEIIDTSNISSSLDNIEKRIDSLENFSQRRLLSKIVYNSEYDDVSKILKDIILLFNGNIDYSKKTNVQVELSNCTCYELVSYPEENAVSIYFNPILQNNYFYYSDDNTNVYRKSGDITIKNIDNSVSCYIPNTCLIPFFSNCQTNRITQKSSNFQNLEGVDIISLVSSNISTENLPQMINSLNIDDIHSIQIGNKLSSFEANLLSNASNLKYIVFNPESKLTILKKDSIVSCNSLTTLNFPSSLSSIELSAIRNNDNLKTIYFNNGDISEEVIKNIGKCNKSIEAIYCLQSNKIEYSRATPSFSTSLFKANNNQNLDDESIGIDDLNYDYNINATNNDSEFEDFPTLTGECINPYVDHSIYHKKSYTYIYTVGIDNVTRKTAWFFELSKLPQHIVTSIQSEENAIVVPLCWNEYYYDFTLNIYESCTKLTGCNRPLCDFINGIIISSSQKSEISLARLGPYSEYNMPDILKKYNNHNDPNKGYEETVFTKTFTSSEKKELSDEEEQRLIEELRKKIETNGQNLKY